MLDRAGILDVVFRPRHRTAVLVQVSSHPSRDARSADLVNRVALFPCRRPASLAVSVYSLEFRRSHATESDHLTQDVSMRRVREAT